MVDGARSQLGRAEQPIRMRQEARRMHFWIGTRPGNLANSAIPPLLKDGAR